MIVRILPVQIPVFWESIKFCATQADEVDQKYRQGYLNGLLHSLLSDKSQCFIRMDESRVLKALAITSMEMNRFPGEKSLIIQVLYSLERVSDELWTRDYDFIRKFAERQQCNSMVFDTRHEQVMELGKLLGFCEYQRSFKCDVGGNYGR